MRRSRRGLAGAVALTLGLLVAGCAHRPPRSALDPRRFTPGAGPTVAVLPFEDFSGVPGSGDKMTRVAFAAMAATGASVIEPGEVDAALTALRVRSTSVLTRDQIRACASRLGVRFLLTGTVLEYGTLHTPDGEVPSLGVTLRLIDGVAAKVTWAGMRARSGEDRETVFGWGRELNLDRLALATMQSMIQEIPFTAAHDSVVSADTVAARGGAR